jgi:hypothetical protein
MSVVDDVTTSGAEVGVELLKAASGAFEHIGFQLADAFDEWQEEGNPDLLAWCAYLVSFAGWWKGRLDAEAAGSADECACEPEPIRQRLWL